MLFPTFMSSLPLLSSAGTSRCVITHSQERASIFFRPSACPYFCAFLASFIRLVLVSSSTHWQQTILKQLVPCFSASSPQSSWVEPPEVRHSPRQSLLLFILCTTPAPSIYNPALSAPFTSATTRMMACCALGLYGLASAASPSTTQTCGPSSH